ncbi:ABC transporter permease [Nocardia cyriacigeorgica]|uniref:ABC-transporter integral membrane protein n=2 Tax=Nocardia cyriacigeorgica TaxID=135487 RepID=H6R1K8_NOCCG|nr:ABC transporter permease [Nocardia cyriacigeorgica]MBF6082056.1 ABC transporter permease [Nocardia cyriacigeorgica]MBF6286227.1 ABC transporter permease [Nocardia cyriacigeorgica]NEW34997.1 ABC transporter permease [Nocardia cyriacigeorgica]CCF65587.1 ABC-transporter integral membrane protein [Nocardia cyriacigeorgica GUH-2]BDU08671.1 ABC transporter permease [Nocardia cyriacigeorgica]
MGSSYTPPALKPVRMAGAAAAIPVQANRRVGHQAITFFQAVAAIPFVLRHYRKEVLRLTADVGFGNGSLIVGGGTAGVVIILCAFGGITVGMESFSALNLLTMGPLTGAISGFATTRELAPILATLAFAIQAGCRFTAQLGSMRISEEIDALESIAIRPLPYLVTTRMIAATLTIVPLYSIGLATAYLATKLSVLFLGGTSAGTYDHYFFQFLIGPDVFFSLLKVIVFVMLSTFIQCYYGYFASGGPEGVGVAAGQAIKMVIVVMVFANLFLTLAIWGIDPGFRISG